MAETLGSLCDKLTIVKLKQFYLQDLTKQASLSLQEKQLQSEIDEFVYHAFAGDIPFERLKFASNKVYKKEGNEIDKLDVQSTIGILVAQLAEINHKLWREQDKVYKFEQVPFEEKDIVVKKLALFNLERNQCIDGIDNKLQSIVKTRGFVLNEKES